MRTTTLGRPIPVALVCAAVGFAAASCETKPTVDPKAVTVSGTAAFSASGQTSQLTAVASYTDGSTRDVTRDSAWTSSNTSVVSVSATGMATANAQGTAQITATFQRLSGTLNALVTVTEPPTNTPCTFNLSYASRTFTAAGADDAVDVGASAGNCAWSAVSDALWLTVQTASGTGSGSLRYSVAGNVSSAERRGNIAVGGQQLAVTQSGATYLYTVSPTERSFGAGGGASSVVVSATPTDGAWTATSDQPWVTVTSNASGQGNRTVTYFVAANTGSSSRTARITVAGLSSVNPPAIHTITQAGAAPSCEYGLTSAKQVSFGPGGGSGTATFTVTSGQGCTWTASVPGAFPWIAVLDSSGSGNITVRFTVAANSGQAREGRVEVRWPGPQAGENILISQTGTAPALFQVSVQR